jgi:hypothetical protein
MRNKMVDHSGERNEALAEVLVKAGVEKMVDEFFLSPRGEEILRTLVTKMAANIIGVHLACAYVKAALTEPEPKPRRRRGSGITAPW